jgi:hypothetical protein
LKRPRKGKQKARVPQPAGDFGPQHQRDGLRGDEERGIAAIPGTRRLEVVTAHDAGEGADPNRTIRRAQIADPLRRMVRAGMPYRCFLAAERFRKDVELAQAGRGVGSQLRPKVNVGPPAGADMPLGALAAAQRVRVAWQDVIGLSDSGIIAWCILPRGGAGPAFGEVDAVAEAMMSDAGFRRQDSERYAAIGFGTLDDYAREVGVRRERVSAQLIAALQRLADHYGFGNVEAPRGFA